MMYQGLFTIFRYSFFKISDKQQYEDLSSYFSNVISEEEIQQNNQNAQKQKFNQQRKHHNNTDLRLSKDKIKTRGGNNIKNEEIKNRKPRTQNRDNQRNNQDHNQQKHNKPFEVKPRDGVNLIEQWSKQQTKENQNQ